jgi:putative FmdB family regulatory protein
MFAIAKLRKIATLSSMPIYEYTCADCGTHFEKLVRRSDADSVRCPKCGEDHLNTEYSTFAARSGSGSKVTSEACAPEGGCGAGMCQAGMCGMNFN